MADARIEVRGERELADKFGRLNFALRTIIARRAALAGALVLRGPIQAAAPIGDTGHLAESIDTVVRSYPGKGVTVALTGPTWPLGAHGIIVEKGTAERRTKQGKSTGEMPANPFVVPTFEANKDLVEAAVIRSLSSGISLGAKL